MDETCLNGHLKVEHMNERGVCTKCADHYRAEMRVHSSIQSPVKVTQRNVSSRH